MQKNPLPEPPQLKVGITDAEFKQAKDDMNQRMGKYVARLDEFSVNRVDEVGQRHRSDVPAQGCFVHRVRDR